MGKQSRQFRGRTRRGGALIWVALMGLMLMGLIGLSVDTAWSAYAGYQLQNSVEAAALAGALIVRHDEEAARLAAIDLAAENAVAGQTISLDLNAANDPEGDIVLGRYMRGTGTFDPELWANAVKVRATRQVDLFFGQIFGISTVNITRSAIAMSSGGDGSALLVLHPFNERSLDVGGSVTLVVDGGPIQVNSSAGEAGRLHGNFAEIEAELVNTVGGWPGRLTAGVDLLTGVLPRPDPLASVPEPGTAGMTDFGAVVVGTNDNVVLQPGHYSGGITIRGTAQMEPGIYILAGLTISSGGLLTGDGVMLFLTSSIDITGANAGVYLSPPDPNSHFFTGATTYEGMTLFQKRGVTAGARITFNGDAALQGTWYFPDARVTVRANGDTHLARMIASELEFTGAGRVTITYTGNLAAAGGNVFLVR